MDAGLAKFHSAQADITQHKLFTFKLIKPNALSDDVASEVGVIKVKSIGSVKVVNFFGFNQGDCFADYETVFFSSDSRVR